jgi:hypothetical protein
VRRAELPAPASLSEVEKPIYSLRSPGFAGNGGIFLNEVTQGVARRLALPWAIVFHPFRVSKWPAAGSDKTDLAVYPLSAAFGAPIPDPASYQGFFVRAGSETGAPGQRQDAPFIIGCILTLFLTGN